MSYAMRRILTATLFALAAACGSDSSPTGPSDGGNGGGDATMGTLKVVNASTNIVSFVRTRTCGATTWGGDILGSSVLGHNQSVSHQFAPGCRDVRLTPSETGADYKIVTNVMIEAGKTATVTVDAFPAE